MKGKVLPEVKQKKFIFQYDPFFSPKRMFGEFKEAIRGKKYIQPENVMVSNDLSTIHRIISKARLKVFAGIKAHQPANVHELAQLLQRDYTNVWRDCQVLVNCGIIELKERGKETQPIVLYEQIVLDFPVNKEVLSKRKSDGLSVRA